MPVSDWDRLAQFEVEIERLETEPRRLELSGFARATTTVVLHGRGQTGRGEDVTYEAAYHDVFPADLPITGRRTLGEYSDLVAQFDLPEYTRWAFESAALDLALQQRGVSLGDAVGRQYRPVRFVVSTRASIAAWREHYPQLEFKIDPEVEWSRGLMEELAATRAIRVADLKGYYRGPGFSGPPADPRLYRDVIEVFADAVIEDAEFTDETRPILRHASGRLSFDAPIHSVVDVEALEVRPRWLNIKPSRFGSCLRLFETLAYCEANGIQMYGGGQFELGVGRDQIQAVASLYYADAPNDVAPRDYNVPPPRPGLPTSPLAPRTQPGL